MKQLIKQGKITEVRDLQSIAYILNDNGLFSITGYKVLKTQDTGFVRCSKLLYNGAVKLVYFIGGLKSLKSMMHVMDNREKLEMIVKVIKAVMDIRSNGFLLCHNLDISMDKIFVDKESHDPQLVYLPVNNSQAGSESFDNEFKDFLKDAITNHIVLSHVVTGILNKVIEENTGDLKELYDEFYSAWGSYEDPWKEDDEQTIVQPKLYMSLANEPHRALFQVNGSEFIIGKSTKCDGEISFNKAISRQHCKLVYHDESYYIIDMNSSNGTYLNKSRLVPDMEYAVKSGDIIRLANSDFIIDVKWEVF